MASADPLTHGLWAHSAPPAPPTDRLRDAVTADVAIVGAGFTGLSAALHLAERGLSAVVLESAQIGFGGSGRNVGLVNAGLWLMPDDVEAVLGPPYGERLISLLGEGPSVVFDLIERHGIECEAQRRGTLHCAVGKAGFEEITRREAQWRARGAAVDVLDAAAAARAVGSSVYAGALLDHRAGTIQPLAYARGLARAAIAAGATVHTDSPVLETRAEGAGWVLRTPEGSVRASQILVATNAYTSGCWPQIADEMVRLPYFNMATPPLGPERLAQVLPGGQGGWDTREILSSFRLDRAGRLVFGSVGSLANSGLGVHARWGRRAMARIFPALKGIDFESHWYGQIGMTADSVPRLHRPAPGVISFSGYNGRGIAPGTVFGVLAARMMAGEGSDADLPLPVSGFARTRMRRARERYYALGAQIAHAVGARL